MDRSLPRDESRFGKLKGRSEVRLRESGAPLGDLVPRTSMLRDDVGEAALPVLPQEANISGCVLPGQARTSRAMLFARSRISRASPSEVPPALS